MRNSQTDVQLLLRKIICYIIKATEILADPELFLMPKVDWLLPLAKLAHAGIL